MQSKNKTACCISDCLSTTTDLTFKFPSKEPEGRSWLKAIQSEELNSLTYTNIIKQRRGVCFKHFPDDAILLLSCGKKMLKKGFLPDLNIKYPSTHMSRNTSEVVERPGKMEKLALKHI